MTKIKYLLLISILLSSTIAFSHHYKGLPHYSYFENYPQVPILDYKASDMAYEVFVTIYNFQGMDLDEVNSPDDVRFYIFIYDLNKNGVYKGAVSFLIKSGEQVVYNVEDILPEQENIFVFNKKITNQERMTFAATIKSKEGTVHNISLPISLRKSFLDKYLIAILIVLFFVIIGILKTWINRKNKGVMGAKRMNGIEIGLKHEAENG